MTTTISRKTTMTPMTKKTKTIADAPGSSVLLCVALDRRDKKKPGQSRFALIAGVGVPRAGLRAAEAKVVLTLKTHPKGKKLETLTVAARRIHVSGPASLRPTV
jgi:hypothetical protein